MQISTNAFASDATLAMKVFAKPSAERNSLLILARETGRACIESSDNDSALLEAFDDAKCGGRRGWIGYEERRTGTERERETCQVVVLSR